MKKELKSGILSADKSADCRPTVGGANVIAVLHLRCCSYFHERIDLKPRPLSGATSTAASNVVCLPDVDHVLP